jgi:hypothetical protein
MSADLLDTIRNVIQDDVGNRGLRTDPAENLVTACAADLPAACRGLAETPRPAVAVITGFFIPHGQPPCAETDGPLGALFLARALVPLGMRVLFATDAYCLPALNAGLEACGLHEAVPVVGLPDPAAGQKLGPAAYVRAFAQAAGPLTHLIALERVGPSHTTESVQASAQTRVVALDLFQREVPPEHQDRCHTMKGRDITDAMSPAHWLIEHAHDLGSKVTTIGIGDGGNEIGMGKIVWEVIRRNIPGGSIVACRVPADHLIVCGVSNWGAYGLATGVRLLREAPFDPQLFAIDRERELLQVMVERGPLVDGVTGLRTATVDGLEFDRYAEPLRKLMQTSPLGLP